MFIAQVELNVRATPSLSADILTKIAADSQVKVDESKITVAEGWVWQKLADQEGWVAERSTDNKNILLDVGSVNAEETDDWSALAAHHMPELLKKELLEMELPPYTHQELINAFYGAAKETGYGDGFELVKQAGIGYIAENRQALYDGKPIRELPNIPDGVRANIVEELVDITQGREASPDVPSNDALSPFTIKGTQIFKDGKPFRFVGVNTRELAWYGFPHNVLTKYTNLGHQDLQIETAFHMRAQVMRFFAPVNVRNDGSPGSEVKEAINRAKTVLDKLAAKGMYALIALSDAKWSGFNIADDGAKNREPKGIYNIGFYRGGYRDHYLPFVQEYVQALGDHPAIFAWAVGNEMQINPHPPDPSNQDCQAIVDFFKHTSEEIRKRSPKKMITTGVESSFHLFVLDAYDRGKYATKLHRLETIDFATMHTYQSTDPGTRFNLGHNNDKIGREIDLARKEWQVPIVMEEIGPTGGRERGNGAQWIRGTVDQLINMGFSGAMQWGFSAPSSDIGVGDGDSGMHNTGGGDPVGHDWQQLFDTYKHFGNQFWA